MEILSLNSFHAINRGQYVRFTIELWCITKSEAFSQSIQSLLTFLSDPSVPNVATAHYTAIQSAFEEPAIVPDIADIFFCF